MSEGVTLRPCVSSMTRSVYAYCGHDASKLQAPGALLPVLVRPRIGRTAHHNVESVFPAPTANIVLRKLDSAQVGRGTVTVMSPGQAASTVLAASSFVRVRRH